MTGGFHGAAQDTCRNWRQTMQLLATTYEHFIKSSIHFSGIPNSSRCQYFYYILSDIVGIPIFHFLFRQTFAIPYHKYDRNRFLYHYAHVHVYFLYRQEQCGFAKYIFELAVRIGHHHNMNDKSDICTIHWNIAHCLGNR